MQGREVVPSRPERNHASALQGFATQEETTRSDFALRGFKITRGFGSGLGVFRGVVFSRIFCGRGGRVFAGFSLEFFG